MPTFARKEINKQIKKLARKTEGEVLFVGVNYQWGEHYEKWFNKARFTTIDINPNTVIPPDFVEDIQHTSFGNNVFDVVIMVGIWELLQSPYMAAKEIQRILVPGGKLLFGFPGYSFTQKNDRFTVRQVVDIIETYFSITNMKVIFYKSPQPFYILGIAKKWSI